MPIVKPTNFRKAMMAAARKSASKFREKHNVPNVRDALDAAQLKEMARLQMINTGLIEVGMEYEERKAKLTQCHTDRLKRLGG